MVVKYLIPKYAKNQARQALEERNSLPKSKRFGLDKTQANKLGIASGVERAKQLVRNKHLNESDAKKVARFSRFNNKTGERAKGAIKLWGGKRFINKLNNQIYGGKT